ncbi:MAG: hypothetical protein IKW81_00185 [Pseudobutyrivibrio sp.]|nr:hypothetical protein [Pseudobutyrivibrio sp.]
MGLLETIKGWWSRMFTNEVKKQFGVEGVESMTMRKAIELWMNIYSGAAPWINEADGIKSIKFAKYLCSETARLVCLDIDINFDGSRKEPMKEFWDKSIYPRFQTWVEYGIAAGSLILKPNGEGVDFVTPDRFQITSTDGNGNITGIVFQDTYQKEKYFYTKLEYHSFFKAFVKMPDSEEYEERTFYRIINKVFESKDSSTLGVEVSLLDTKWAGLEPVTDIVKGNGDKLDGMLFGYFKMPIANDIDYDSPLGVSLFAEAMEELKDLDIAYSRNAEEIKHSSRIVLLDERLTEKGVIDGKGKRHRIHIPLPRYVKSMNVLTESNEVYHEINPSLNTSTRKEGIDFQLSLIGRKCGFSNGYFVLDQKTGMITATQVEADDRETIQTIKSIRDALRVCVDELLYAQSVFMDLYELAPLGDYEANYAWGDITYNYEEDKQNWWKYVQAGKVPAWKYFVKFEGMSEEEAKAMEEEAAPEMFAAE